MSTSINSSLAVSGMTLRVRVANSAPMVPISSGLVSNFTCRQCSFRSLHSEIQSISISFLPQRSFRIEISVCERWTLRLSSAVMNLEGCTVPFLSLSQSSKNNLGLTDWSLQLRAIFFKTSVRPPSNDPDASTVLVKTTGTSFSGLYGWLVRFRSSRKLQQLICSLGSSLSLQCSAILKISLLSITLKLPNASINTFVNYFLIIFFLLCKSQFLK